MTSAPKPDKKPDSSVRKALLRSVAPFNDLSDEELDVVVSRSEFLSFARGDTIFDQIGGYGKLYIVQQGEVLISKPTESEREISLATFVGGESFGEMSLFDSQPASTVARAETEVCIVVFPSGKPLAAEALADQPAVHAKILHNLLVTVAGRIRSTNRLVAEKSPWVQELKRQVLVDKLTGLYNNSYLEEEFGKRFDSQPSEDSVLVLKPDNFKTINDHYGHEAGDQVLGLLARTIQKKKREKDIAIRYHGDVFAVVLPETDLNEARSLANGLRTAVADLDVSGIIESGSEGNVNQAESRPGLRVKVSVGVAVYPNGGRRAADLVEKAYQNMFVARNRGGNRLCCAQSTSPKAG